MKKTALSFIIWLSIQTMEESLVLFSGGIDSTTALYWALGRCEKVHTLTFDYGQRHSIEILMAEKLVQKLRVPQKILRVDLKQIGGSALTDAHLPLPQYVNVDKIEEGLPLTYVPFRNGIFLSMASAWAEVEGIKEIVCGFHVMDSPNYPDTREQFVKSMEEAVNQGTRILPDQDRIQITAPFVNMKKSDIIKEGLSLGADYSYSVSCYAGAEVPCQKCSACILRRKAWEEVGQKDPLILRLEKEGRL
ncbi:MAG: 7-cyano-7-deazaguanine synthase QueC [Candidatus Aminicenantes bacterium]|nr:7-cyano-7-deazaguanine synthase QueC [Candidatus Aminicenantes bacterium]MDH5706505.1 7-cyano-7-deazaguanine synthase QueC [Candidatus Aminicenantes bacterium]